MQETRFIAFYLSFYALNPQIIGKIASVKIPIAIDYIQVKAFISHRSTGGVGTQFFSRGQI
jgi:hypothetical protein